MRDAETLLAQSRDLHSWIQALKAPDPGSRREAAEVLGEIGDERALYPLLCALQDENQGVQQAAMDALARIGGAFTVYCLLPLLRDDRPDLRNMAREVLQQIGSSGKDLLCRALRDRDPDVRRMVADILAVLRDPDTVEALIQALQDPNPNVRASVAAALGEIGDPMAVEPLLDLLQDIPWVAFFAVRALGQIRDPRALPALLDLVQGEDGGSDREMLQREALDAIGALCSQECRQELLSLWKTLKPPLRPVVARILVQSWEGDLAQLLEEVDPEAFGKDLLEIYQETDPQTGLVLIQAFARLRVPGSSRAVLDLSDRLDLENPEYFHLLEEALVLLGEVPLLMEALSTGTENIRRLALRALGSLGAREAVPELLQAYQETDDVLYQAEILHTLGRIGAPEGLDLLQQALHDEIPLIRRAAAEALGPFQGKGREEAFWEQLEREEDRHVAYAILSSLLKRGGAATTSRLVSLMGHPNPLVREVAAWGLGQQQEPEARKALLQGISDPEWRVRRRSVEALACDASREALEGLLMATCDDREEVRIAAIRGLWEQWQIQGNADPGLRKTILEALIAALRDDHIRVRCQALEVMGRTRDPQVIPVLLEAARTERGPSQVLAIEALGWLRAKEAVPFLESLTGEPNPGLREVALKALEQIRS